LGRCRQTRKPVNAFSFSKENSKMEFGLWCMSGFVSVVMPMHGTLKCLQSDNAEQQTKWLSYWMLMTPFIFLEHLGPFAFISFSCACFYLVKLLFACYLLLPHFEGAQKMLHHMVVSYLVHYEQHIDTNVSMLKRKASLKAFELKEKGLQQFTRHSVSLLISSLKFATLSEQATQGSSKEQVDIAAILAAARAVQPSD